MNLEASLHSLLSFAWTLTRPTSGLRQNIVFSYSEMIRVSFSLFLYFSFFCCCYFKLLLIFTKNVLLLLYYYYFFMKIILIFSHPGMFQHVPECSVFQLVTLSFSQFHAQRNWIKSVRKTTMLFWSLMWLRKIETSFFTVCFVRLVVHRQ